MSSNLTGIGLERNDLTDWNFSNKNLTNANFSSLDLNRRHIQRRDRQVVQISMARPTPVLLPPNSTAPPATSAAI